MQAADVLTGLVYVANERAKGTEQDGPANDLDLHRVSDCIQQNSVQKGKGLQRLLAICHELIEDVNAMNLQQIYKII